MAKHFDVSKFRKGITKSIQGVSVGFNDPDTWVCTGNYALNFLISGDFKKGVPLSKVSIFAGETGCLPESAKVTIQTYVNEHFWKRQVSVGELKKLYHMMTVDDYYFQHTLEIETADGFHEITDWFDKGIMEMVKISTKSHQTICATNHAIQVIETDNPEDISWKLAEDLRVGDLVLTVSGVEAVISVEESEPQECYDFTVNHENHRYYGDGFSSHNSGKSYIVSGNLVRNAQKQGIFVVMIDSESALDEAWLKRLGVDTSEEKLLKLNMAMIDDVAKTISDFMKQYKDMSSEDRPKVLFVIDSLGMLLTPTDVNQFESGELKGDLGRKPKALGGLIRNCVNMFGAYNVGLVAVNHSYDSQDPYNPDPKISGGSMAQYAASIVVAMKKMKLKEDEDGAKVTQVLGIRSGCKIMKTRFAKPFEDTEIYIPWNTGMNIYSGMFELMEKKGLLNKEGNRYAYTDLNGNVHKYFRKEWNKNINGVLDLVMDEYATKVKPEEYDHTNDLEYDESESVVSTNE